MNTRFPSEWKKFQARVQQTVADAARLGSRELQRGMSYAKTNIERVHLVSRRKDLFSELGRALYEAHVDGPPPEVARYLAETEFAEIISEITDIDAELARRASAT